MIDLILHYWPLALALIGGVFGFIKNTQIKNAKFELEAEKVRRKSAELNSDTANRVANAAIESEKEMHDAINLEVEHARKSSDHFSKGF